MPEKSESDIFGMKRNFGQLIINAIILTVIAVSSVQTLALEPEQTLRSLRKNGLEAPSLSQLEALDYLTSPFARSRLSKPLRSPSTPSPSLASYLHKTLGPPQSTNFTCEQCLEMEKALGAAIIAGDHEMKGHEEEVCKDILQKGHSEISKMTLEQCVYLLGQMLYIPNELVERLLIRNSGILCYLFMEICPYTQSTVQWYNSAALIQQILDIPRPKQVEKRRYEQKVESDLRNVRILHFSDVHLKLKYREGASADVKKYGLNNCQNITHERVGPKAGMFGDQNCDLPYSLFDALVNSSQTFHPDIIIYTGDNNDHNVANYDVKDNNFTETKMIADSLREAFPDAIIVPTLGNIETAPLDHQFDHLSGSTNWALKGAAQAYASLLTKEQTLSLQENGFYAVEIKKFNLRILSLMSSLYDSSNAFMVARTPNPNKIFSFLWDNLIDAEKKGEKVFVISHIPPSGEMVSQFENILAAFYERFEDTIVQHFSGHNHHDMMSFFTVPVNTTARDNLKTPREQVLSNTIPGLRRVTVPVSIAGAVSPLNNISPTYRIWLYDSVDGMLKDYDEFKFRLDQANQFHSKFEWAYFYTFTKAYGLSDASKESYTILRDKMLTNNEDVLGIYVNIRSNFRWGKLSITPHQVALELCNLMTNAIKIVECIKLVDLDFVITPALIASLALKDYFILEDPRPSAATTTAPQQ
jgi:hypothetical protein